MGTTVRSYSFFRALTVFSDSCPWPTDSCPIWQLSDLTVVWSDSCLHWQLSDLTVVRSYRCLILQLISDSCLLTSPWPSSSSLCASNGGRRMARNPVEKEHFNISILTGFCQTIPDDIMSVWIQITLTLSDSLLCSQGQESTSKLTYKSISNFTAVVN